MSKARISGAWTLLVFAAGLVAGAGIFRLSDGSEPSTQARPTSSEPRRPGPLVCENVALSGGSAPAADDLRLRFCLAQLEAAHKAQRRVVQPWPEVDDPIWAGELPGEWTASMERVIRDCDVPGELVITDCSEPPCTAAFRDADHEAVSAALGDCPSFRAAFPRPEVDPVPFTVPCGDGRHETMVLVTTFDEDQRRAWFEEIGLAGAMDDHELSAWIEGLRVLSRRADGLVPLWSCAEP